MSNVITRIGLAASLAIALLSGSAAWSQDQEQAEDVSPAAEAEAGAAGEAPEASAATEETEAGDEDGPAVGLDEIPELDQQTHEEDDDEFIPTEEIPVDQSIPFPTDI